MARTSEISWTQKYIYHVFFHMWNVDKGGRHESRRGTIWEEKGGQW
jgi:hypothetical protein